LPVCKGGRRRSPRRAAALRLPRAELRVLCVECTAKKGLCITMAPVGELLENLATAGFVLSVEHRAALASSLLILKQNEKFESVHFWGKIAGTTTDYFICQGFGKQALTDRKSFYSMDCLNWAQLPTVHPVIAASAKLIKGRFTGSASNEFTVTEPGPSADEAPVDLPDDVKALRSVDQKEEGSTVTTTIAEDKRLAAVIAAIDHECAAVPYGAYRKTAAGEIVPTPNFGGLSGEDAGKLSSYVHFRVPLAKKEPLERASSDKALDVFDGLADDVPNGCWALTTSSSAECVHLKSLQWPGFTLYHVPDTDRYGSVYNGTGLLNKDLAFMLH